MPKKAKSFPCPYSPSCFTCPLSDCRVNGNYNAMAGEHYVDPKDRPKRKRLQPA